MPSSPRSALRYWPEMYGFNIVGNGPCYVNSVERGSVAHQAGLMAGDQVLELDGHNVANMSGDALKTLAKHSRTIPPSIGVVSRVQYVELVASRKFGYGLTLRGMHPVFIESIEQQGPAFQSGLRQGDVVLEVNGRKVRNAGAVKPLFESRLTKLTLAIIAIENRNMSVNEQPRGPGSRVRKARELFARMNIILGTDYEKKMAVVGVLKQYAEDQHVDKFCRALNLLLKTPHHRKLLRDIRPFVPVKHHPRLDVLVAQTEYNSQSDYDTSDGSSSRFEMYPNPAVLTDERRTVRIIRSGEGSFGFILRGHTPVYIESIDPGGAAEKAGLLPGDCILRLNGLDVRHCGHGHLVRLLQGSGSNPTLEVVQQLDRDGVAVRHPSFMSSGSSVSSHTSSNWLNDTSPIVDIEGRTFKQRVEHLLTKKEKTYLRRSLINYNNSKNIATFVEELGTICDTPSKRTLWVFMVPTLSTNHQEYAMKNIDVPRHMLMDMLTKNEQSERRLPVNLAQELTQSNNNHFLANGQPSRSYGGDMAWVDDLNQNSKLATFKQQLEYLLTSRERSQLKKALKIYAQKRNIHNLMEDLMVILDTPSKRTLWLYILPLMSEQHQDYCRRIMDIRVTPKPGPHESTYYAPSTGSTATENSYVPSTESSYTEQRIHAQPQAGDVMFQNDDDVKYFGEPVRNHRGGSVSLESDGTNSEDFDSEPIATLRHWSTNQTRVLPMTRLSSIGSYDVTRAIHGQTSVSDGTGPMTYITHDRPVLSASRGIQANGTLEDDFVTLNPAYESQKMKAMQGHTGQMKVKVIRETSCQTQSNGTNGHNDWLHYPPRESKEISNPTRRYTKGLKNSNGQPHNLYEEVNYRKANGAVSSRVKVVKYGRPEHADDSDASGKMSQDSFDAKAAYALKELDDAVANEISDPESRGVSPQHKPVQQVPPPPPPAPPPPPVVPPVPPINVDFDSAPQMNVKRINWEKLEVNDIQNTVWGQVKPSDSDYLNDVVKFLELEQQFSTRKPKQSPSFKTSKKEVCILASKKAYNLSILLGHLKFRVGHIKDALYSIDEEVLSQELLGQMLAYCPDKMELEKYNTYTGPVENLSKVDHFAYTLSRVPGYEQRLKALLFKASFTEKVEEVKQSLTYIKQASHQLRNSIKLAKILELVLAMGNYMNKGNARVGSAAAFKIGFLSQLDITKTSDGKSTFLHVLATAVQNKFPNMINLSEDLAAVRLASKVPNEQIDQELVELRKVLQDLAEATRNLGSPNLSPKVNDKFQDIMGHFISQASDEIQALFSLQVNAMEEFHNMAQYFGEDPSTSSTSEIFGIFAQFMTKFEKAHTENMMVYRKR